MNHPLKKATHYPLQYRCALKKKEDKGGVPEKAPFSHLPDCGRVATSTNASAGIGTLRYVLRLPRLHRAGPSASLDKSRDET
jgi:hypothetical protein